MYTCMDRRQEAKNMVPRYLQEDDVSDECQEVLSRLRRERGWIGSYIYEYEGFWLPPRHLQGVIACRRHFQARDSDTILVTNPKSGTTWLKAMAFALLNRSKNLNPHPLLTTNPHDLVPFLEPKLYGSRHLPDLSTFTSPRLFASHAPINLLASSILNSSCKIVYLSRDPKDVFASLWHFSNKVKPKEQKPNELAEVFDKFCMGMHGYGPFWDHVLGFWRASSENPRRVLFLKYEEIKQQPAGGLRRLAEFLGCPFSSEEESGGMVDEIVKLCSFDCLSELEVNRTGRLSTGVVNEAYFRKGAVGGWSEVLSGEMAERLDRITEEKMRGHEFKF